MTKTAAAKMTNRPIPTEAREAIGSCGRILGALFLTYPREPAFQLLREQLEQLPSLADWPFGTEDELRVAHALMQEGLTETDAANAANATDTGLAREYQRLFIGPHHFKAPAWGSVYLDKDQVLFGTSLLELRQWMRENDIVVNQEKREPEDHIGRMLVLMGWLATEKPEGLHTYLAEHLMPWVPRYLQVLRADARQPFYEGLAVLTQSTLEGIVENLGVRVSKKKLYV
ncbi:MAG: Tat proofreading chaperone DmsD [Coriobacteriales bacterium]|jgi:TorA maturation chaperone TorD|nr:Tat proofreading chaperone DmsD [Coriobacteriales bacterium]